MKAKKKEEDFYKKYPECRIKISFSNNVSGNNQRLILDQFFGTAGLYDSYSTKDQFLDVHGRNLRLFSIVEMSFHPGETILAVMEELQNIMENQEIIL